MSNPVATAVTDVAVEPQTLRASVTAIARAAKTAARVVAKASTATRRQALLAIADEIVARRDEILAANARSRRGQSRRHGNRDARSFDA